VVGAADMAGVMWVVLLLLLRVAVVLSVVVVDGIVVVVVVLELLRARRLRAQRGLMSGVHVAQWAAVARDAYTTSAGDGGDDGGDDNSGSGSGEQRQRSML
jgi:hypothetical protein